MFCCQKIKLFSADIFLITFPLHVPNGARNKLIPIATRVVFV